MYSIYGIFSPLQTKTYFYNKNGQTSECYTNEFFTYGRNNNGKFNKEKFIIEQKNLICCFNGFLFDIDNYSNQKEYFKANLHEHNYVKFISKLNGSFNGYIYLKNIKKIILFTDHLATKKLFYSLVDNTFFFSSLLKDVTEIRKDFSELKINLSSIYKFLAFGYMLNNETLFENIHQVPAGTILEFDCTKHSIQEIKYNSWNISKNELISPENIIDTYEDIIHKSVKRILDINKQNNYKVVTSLSGGLDAKTVAVMLSEEYHKNFLTFTFAESNSLDATIAQTISNNLQTEHIYYSLNNGTFLSKNVHQYIEATNGLVSIQGSLHGYNACKNINTSEFGLHLSGQIGDVIFGSFVRPSFDINNDYIHLSYCGLATKSIYKKTSNLYEILKNYENDRYELFSYEQRQPNGTIYGDIAVDEFFDTISPFYNKELIQFTLSVPDKYKLNHYIHLKWLKKHHPKVLQFKLDKCNCKPNNALKVQILKKTYGLINAIKKRFKIKYDNMNPFDIWFRENPTILEFLQKTYEENIDILEFDQKLKRDVEEYFYLKSDRYKRNKFVVVTLLLSLRFHMKEGSL